MQTPTLNKRITLCLKEGFHICYQQLVNKFFLKQIFVKKNRVSKDNATSYYQNR